jgi:soluble lytic murein transglycosylase
MRPEARFALAFDARARAKHDEALSHLDAALAEGASETDEGLFGRAAYWRARTLMQLGRRAEALASYVEVARNRPLSYHAQQARARVHELDRAAARRLAAELGGVPSPPPLAFPLRAEMQSPAFDSALELLRVGEIELARRELSFLGALGAGADEDLLWLAAALLDRAGAYADASALARGRLRGFEKTVPQGKAAALWRIAYPDAYAPLIEQVAGESSVPAAFIRAVAREESAFNPEAISSANAIGLIQLMVPTARAHGKALGLPADPASLKRPEINLRIGADFIAELRRRYATNPAIVPAAYNAGHGAANRWLRERPKLDLDEWIERIPYSETRRYTRRVLQSYGVYTFLQTGNLPELPKRLPAL